MNTRFFQRILPRFDNGSFTVTYRSLREAAMLGQRARLPQMAAALSYRTIFGLLPVVIVALVGLKVFTAPADMERLVKTVLDRAGISAIAVEDSADSFVGPVLPGHTQAGPPSAPAADSTGGRRLDQWINQLITRVNSVSFATIGVIGMVALIYAALAMLVEIERAFNQVYRAPRGRSWSRRVVLYWTLLTLGPLALFATFYIGIRARALTEHLIASLPGASGEFSAIGVVILGYITTVAISGAVLLLLYMAVPNARVAFRPALSGAVLAAIGWEAGKWGFAQYIEFTRGESYVRLYGSVALIPLFMLWVYLTWVVVLMGLQVAFHLQFRNRPDPTTVILDSGRSITEPAAALGVMEAMARRFARGKPSTTGDIAADVAAAEPVVALLLERLARAGLVHAVAEAAGGSGPEAPVPITPDRDSAHDASINRRLRYTLARPPESIALRSVLESAFDAPLLRREPDESSGHDRGGPRPESRDVAALLRQAQLDAVGDRTLASLLMTSRGSTRSSAVQTAAGVP